MAGGLESADVWGDQEDVSSLAHILILIIYGLFDD